MLRIVSETHGGLPTLLELLAALSPQAERLQWSVLDLHEVVAAHDPELPEEAVRRVEASPSGWTLTFDELLAFAAAIAQVIDGVFVGQTASDRPLTRADDDTALVTSAEMVVAGIDSSFWLLSAPEDVLSRVRASFDAVNDIEPGSVALSTWGRDY